MTSVFQLDIQHLADHCFVKLSWGEGLQLSTTLPYPEALPELYQTWQRAYLSFYSTELRGTSQLSQTLTLPEVDWRIRLVQAEAALLAAFHQWLHSDLLYDIRSTIAQALKPNELAQAAPQVDLFLTCHSEPLATLPWETWEIGTEWGTRGALRLIRSPASIRHETIAPRRGRTRILVFSGDETSLDFKGERDAIQRLLKPIAEVVTIGWRITSTQGTELIAKLQQALSDEQGWDIFLFFGHSDTASLTGGELAIAPDTWIAIAEIAPQLLQAKQRGLQFALFNSCKGLDIARSLVNLGLSQVAIMREPIHNRVAQTFLVQLLQGLAQHRDVHDALLGAVQDLKLNHNLTFPSAYLIPSLFRHPQAELFRIPPRGWRQTLKRWRPQRQEGIALSLVLLCSLLPPIQSLLLEPRLAMQAVYRHLMHQLPDKTIPPIQLVLIDQDSLTQAKIAADKVYPIDRRYLAQILDKLATWPTQVIGVDYTLDQPTPEDPRLVTTVRQLVQQGTWLVLATYQDPTSGQERQVNVEGITPQWIVPANVDAPFGYVALPPQGATCSSRPCPFAYVLAVLHSLHVQPAADGLKPQPQQPTALGEQLVTALATHPHPSDVAFWQRAPARLTALTQWSFSLGQIWLQPIIDFSIPPSQVYERIPAWQVLEAPAPNPSDPEPHQQVVILAPGGYAEAEDTFEAPLAIHYWRSQAEKSIGATPALTGGEIHGYMLHHLLSRHFVIAIPDLWMTGVAILIGKGTVLLWGQFPGQRRWGLMGLMGGTIAYGWLSLQVFVSAALLLPWLLPSLVIWGYVFPTVRPK